MGQVMPSSGNEIDWPAGPAHQRARQRRLCLELTRLRGRRTTTIRFGRDGIFVNTSQAQCLSRQPDSRPAFRRPLHVHQRQRVSGNVSIGNDIGYALMFSSKLKVDRQRFDRRSRPRACCSTTPTTPQIARQSDPSAAARNASSCTTPTRTRSAGNRFEGCQIGVHFTAGSERTSSPAMPSSATRRR